MNGSDNEFLERCKNVDFSAESTSYEKNLEGLKTKINYEGNPIMKKIKKMPFAVAATLVIMLSFSVVALAATAWRYLDTRILQGEEYVHHFTVSESEDGTIQIWATEIDSAASGPIIAEVDGEEVVLMDAHDYDDLDEALDRLAATLGSVMMPTQLPDGFVFENATYYAHVTALSINFHYGEHFLNIYIAHYPEEWDLPYWAGDLEPVEVNGFSGKTGGGTLGLQVGDILYMFDGYNADLDYSQLIEIAESMQ
jgi:hypothetical protein